MRTGVAIALYNGIQFLKKQIDSLLEQTVLPDIIVCCDDGSTDGTMDWLGNYVRELGQDSRFLLVRNPQRLGYVQNFYKALDLCDADILFLCDQDDIWDRTKIERMTSALMDNKNYSLISCAHNLIGSQDEPVTSMRYSQKSGSGALQPVSEKEIVTLFRWPGMTMALRKNFWESVRNDAVSIDAPHDRVLALLAASKGGMAYLDCALCSHRLHTSNSGGEQDDLEMILGRDFKVKELQTSLKWLNAQLQYSECFSVDARNALSGYRDYIALRTKAVENRSILPLLKTFTNCRNYINLKGILADTVSILFRK